MIGYLNDKAGGNPFVNAGTAVLVANLRYVTDLYARRPKTGMTPTLEI